MKNIRRTIRRLHCFDQLVEALRKAWTYIDRRTDEDREPVLDEIEAALKAAEGQTTC